MFCSMHRRWLQSKVFRERGFGCQCEGNQLWHRIQGVEPTFSYMSWGCWANIHPSYCQWSDSHAEGGVGGPSQAPTRRQCHESCSCLESVWSERTHQRLGGFKRLSHIRCETSRALRIDIEHPRRGNWMGGLLVDGWFPSYLYHYRPRSVRKYPHWD